MMKTQIGLGVLSIPTAFDSLGIVPGVIVLFGIAIITTWSDYVIGGFKLNHPEVYGIDDAGALIFGRTGRAVLSAAFCLCMYTQPRMSSNSLIPYRLDLRERLRHPGNLDWIERSVYPRRMHCCFCCHCCHSWFHLQ